MLKLMIIPMTFCFLSPFEYSVAQFVYFEFQRKKISELVSKSSIIVILNPLAYKSVKVFSIIRRLYFTSQLHKIFTPTIDINNFHNVLRANEEFIWIEYSIPKLQIDCVSWWIHTWYEIILLHWYSLQYCSDQKWDIKDWIEKQFSFTQREQWNNKVLSSVRLQSSFGSTHFIHCRFQYELKSICIFA